MPLPVGLTAGLLLGLALPPTQVRALGAYIGGPVGLALGSAVAAGWGLRARSRGRPVPLWEPLVLGLWALAVLGLLGGLLVGDPSFFGWRQELNTLRTIPPGLTGRMLVTAEPGGRRLLDTTDPQALDDFVTALRDVRPWYWWGSEADAGSGSEWSVIAAWSGTSVALTCSMGPSRPDEVRGHAMTFKGLAHGSGALFRSAGLKRWLERYVGTPPTSEHIP